MRTRALTCLFVIVVLFGVIPATARGADSGKNHFAQIASDSIIPFLVLGMGSLALDGKNIGVEERQAAKALAATGLATELLKRTVSEKRPRSASKTSFPSGHTSAAFAMATIVSDYKPRLKIPAYAVATTIGWSRVELRAHRWRDVIAGAGLGYAIARHYTGKRVSVSPNGLNLNYRF